MRFIDNGPSIPDELLLARDQGRVVFFCGAGVSRAKAGLPDFFKLAKEVIKSLGVTSDSPVHKVLEQASKVSEETNVPGLISADRLFGLLEKEFYRTDIEKAAAEALRVDSPDLTAHQVLIDLATTPAGLVRLVTTNFDRLFNDCDANLKSWQPPRLPSLTRPKDLNGIVYLHGRVSEDYSRAEEDGFILSSSEFGRAYLSEAWATDFFKEILSKYIVVFVGYAADDPPVHYLLEALSKGRENLKHIYAFQPSSIEEARAKWQHKGVEAIAYDPADGHKALWVSLEKWAERAKDIEKWYNQIIAMAARGPRELAAFERGLVTHVISSTEGAKRFAQADIPPPAEWLLVFDKYCRYEKPSRIASRGSLEQAVDPFELYSIDSDPVPEKIAPDDYYTKRELPSGVWDAFELTHVDRADRQENQFSYLRSHSTSYEPGLCGRLSYIGTWITRVADDPVTLWWAHRQGDLHPSVISQIKWRLDREGINRQEVANAWRYLFEANKDKRKPNDLDWYQLNRRITKEGWSWGAVRHYLECLRPRLVIDNSYEFAPILSGSDDVKIKSIICPTIYYATPHSSLDVPKKWLPSVLEGLRQHLHTVIQLESDVEPPSMFRFSTLTLEDDEDDHLGNNSVFVLLRRITEKFDALVQNDTGAAIKEFNAWQNNNSKHFLLLRVWASRNPKIVPVDLVESLFAQDLNQGLFWKSSLSRDILLTLKARWSELTDSGRAKIEGRIVKGPDKLGQEDDEAYQTYRSWSVLNRLHWLSRNGCALNCDLDVITEQLKKYAPQWNVESADDEAKSDKSRGGFVRIEQNYSQLENLSLKDILAKAVTLRGRTEDFLVRAEPFQGFVDAWPAKSFSVLNLAAQKKEYPDWAWRLFLNSEKRKEDKPLFMMLIAERLYRYPNVAFDSLTPDIALWLHKVSKILVKNYPKSFYRLFDKLLSIAKEKPTVFQSSLLSSKKQIDWAEVALNSPVSPLVQALFNDPRLNIDEHSMPDDWLARVDNMLQLGDDLSRYTLVMCSHGLGWFYARDAKWTRVYLLSNKNNAELESRQAFWFGFFWGLKRPPAPELYRELKESLLTFKDAVEFSRTGYSKVLSRVLLFGWLNIDEITGEPYISNEEFREFLVKCDDEYRSHMLWQIMVWSKEDVDDQDWGNQLVKLFKDVWPKQISVKSLVTTLSLCNLAFSSKNLFEKTARLVIPHLVQLNSGSMPFLDILEETDQIIQNNPELVLAIVYKILPDEVNAWPYQIDKIFFAIEEADPNLKYDERMIEIKRKWNSR